MIFNKDEVPFFYDLEETNKQVLKDGVVYDIYTAPNWEIVQKIDMLMGNNDLGFDLDEYLIKRKDI